MNLARIPLLVSLAALVGAPAARAQLQLSGTIAGEITDLTSSGGASATAKYALTPPGYVTPGSISQSGSGQFTSAFTLKAAKSSGSATFTYQPSEGTADPTSAFSGIEDGDTLGLGSFRLSNTSIPSGGSVSFMMSIDFGTLQLDNGVVPVTPLLADVPILNLPVTLTLNPVGSSAVLSLSTAYDPSTMFNSTVNLGDGYVLDLAPADTLNLLLSELETDGFKSTKSSVKAFGTGDLFVADILTPVPEPSTYGLCAALLLAGVAGYFRLRGRPAASPGQAC